MAGVKWLSIPVDKDEHKILDAGAQLSNTPIKVFIKKAALFHAAKIYERYEERMKDEGGNTKELSSGTDTDAGAGEDTAGAGGEVGGS